MAAKKEIVKEIMLEGMQEAPAQKKEKLGTEVSVSTQETMMYDAWEFVKGARKLFDVSPDLVAAALKSRGIVRCTKADAEKVVKAFVERKVK